MARPRKFTDASTGKVGKEKKEERKKEEAALEDFDDISLTPPNWLSKEAKTEYKRIVPLMSKLPIAALDMASVVMYCDYYSKYKAASLCVEEQGRTIIELDGQGNDKKKVNPEFTAMNDAARMVRSLSGGLGLTIDSRMRIVVPKTKEKSDLFAEWLADD